MQTRRVLASLCRNKRGVTLWELLIAVAIIEVTVLGFFLLVEKSLQSAAHHRDLARALICTQNELEWRCAKLATTGTMSGRGMFSFANPTAADLPPEYRSTVVIEPLENGIWHLRAEVTKEHPQRSLNVTLETFVAKGGQ